MIPLFEGYLVGMLYGLLGSLKDRRFLALAFFYLVVIVSAHFYLVPVSGILGVWFYFGCGAAQLIVLLSALLIRTKASAPIALLAYGAVIANTLAFQNYPSQAGIHNYYYGLINTVQTLQITSLCVFSPLSVYLLGLVTGRVKITRMPPLWMRSKSHSET